MIDAFGSLSFFIWAGGITLGALILGIIERSLRTYTLIASLLVLALITVESPRRGVLLTGFIVFAIALAFAHLKFRQWAGSNQLWEKKAVIAVGLIPLVVVKVSPFFQQLNWLTIIGISYLTFRLIQVLLEISDGIIKSLSLPQLTSFLVFFPTLTSGPIDRSRRFDSDAKTVRPRAEYLALVGQGSTRIIIGIGYKFVAAAICSWGLSQLPKTVAGEFWAMYLYSGQLFFDFAGYSLMAVGLAAFYGIRVPMNFRYPFISESIKDFWNRWHITLSFWLRDYVYMRLVRTLISKKLVSTTAAGRIGFFVNMAVMGLWHGPTWPYIIYGLYHGTLLVAQDIYEKSCPWYRYHDRTWYRVIAIIITFHLVCFGFYIFSGRMF